MTKPFNDMQTRQDAGKCEFVILGVDDWKSCLDRTVTVNDGWEKLCGGREVPLMTCLEKEAEVNRQSLERSIVNTLLAMGYSLEELEVDIAGNEDESSWGKCIWFKEHPAYEKPIPEMFTDTAINNPAFCHAMFRTEHAGEKHYGLYSMQMMASTKVLLHKTLIYRKVVFSAPKASSQSEAA